MERIGIIGISGYSGGVTLELLLNHPEVRVTYVSANNTTGTIDEIWPRLKGKTKLVCHKYDLKAAIQKADIFFLAVPHTISMEITPQLLKNGKRVIDLSGDYRLKDAKEYKEWYGKAHKDQVNLEKAVYGLPELFREKIKKAQLISNPGCYPTGAILGLLPLFTTQAKKIKDVIIDAKSGVSGAGKKAAAGLMYCEVNENCKAYKVFHHQHQPEIAQYLSHVAKTDVDPVFVPHLLPVNRGILSTIYVKLGAAMTQSQVQGIFQKFYKTEKFVRVLKAGEQPELKHVNGTNYCDIGITVNPKKTVTVITTAIDNLMKGAAGQAIQNMNIMCKFDEKEGLQ